MKKVLSMLAAALMGIMLLPPSPAAGEEMSLMAFNVGKADCLLLRSGESAYLIDTGKSRHWDFLEEGLKALEVDHLDGVIITHMDNDHVGGLKKLLKSDFTVDHIYVPAFYLPENGKDTESPAEKTAGKQGREVEKLLGGDELPLDSGSMRVLGPIHAATDKEDSNSIVLYVQAAGGSMLLAGDMEFPEEQDLLAEGVIPQADVLKVGNHGDDDATSNALLSAVRPKIGIISTSTEEKANTPAARTLRDLAGWNVEVYQTQEAEWGILVTIRDGEITAERVNELQ